MHLRRLGFYVIMLLAVSAFGQQTGSISGRVSATDGSALPGVTVEARSNVLPQPRVTTTDSSGDYQLPALQPGTYTLTFSLSGMQSATRKAEVILSQNTAADAKLGVQGVSESITVTAESSLVDKESTALQNGLSSQEIQELPVGQQYRDLLKFIPGVPQTPNGTTVPSGGGSGQDNVYQFDGVNVTLPLYGTLSAEPASYDISQVSIIKGGAKAVDFNRSGGFTINSESKSGTNKLSGQASYQIQNHSMTAKKVTTSVAQFQQNQSWGEANLGGPILSDRLFFYGSFYRPEVNRNNVTNAYGALPKYQSTRNEEFGKLTFTPTSSWLINGSYRTSKRTDTGTSFPSLSFSTATTGTGGQSTQNIGTLDASWITNSKSYATFKFTDYKLRTHGVPDFTAGATPSIAAGTMLDIANLDKIGRLSVPLPTTNASFNSFIAPFIAKYGYPSNGTNLGGGYVGVGDTFDKDEFGRRNGQVGYNLSLGTNITHDLHAGYQRYTDTEDLTRTSNGWGDISILGGASNCPASACGTAKPAFFQAQFLQDTIPSSPVHSIHAPFRSQNLELNDTMHWGNWSFNAGVVASHDVLYGQGLKNDSSQISGYTLCPGCQYKMYDVPFRKMIQPRLGATWAYNGQDTVYASVARYNPAANSLPRAASYDRNYTIRVINAYFDANGVLMGTSPLASSSGKLFVPNMDPREVKEYMIGTAQQINSRWSARLYGRYRKGDHFWEDTNNTARNDYDAPAPIPHTPYIPNLDAYRLQIGNGVRSAGGSSYVVAQLDGAFTKYYEATMETEWRGNRNSVKGSYTWNHYYGNFDQDDTTGAGGSDANTYIGSSNLADGPGKQLWNLKYGTLHGDRRHQLKLYGTHMLPWNATTGAYAVYQSGQPWEVWDYSLYDKYPDNSHSSTSGETIKFAEPAGTRRSPSHYQFDLDYTQNIPVTGLNLQLSADAYNIFNKQTGYDFAPRVHSAGFGTPLGYWSPRRFQLAARVQF